MMHATDSSAAGGAAPDPLGTIKLIVAWAIVGIPLLWGVSQVFQKSLALFR
jgi:hypothetical protein